MKVKLAFWYKGHKPGDVVEVSDEEAAVMRRDGRVAAVVPESENKKGNAESKEKGKKSEE